MRQPLLRAEGLVRRFGRRTVLEGVTVEVFAGEVVGLLGPNGAGKTTAFGIVAGLLAPHGGSVSLAGAAGQVLDLEGMSLQERAVAGLGYLPQEPSVFGALTVEQNLIAVLEATAAPRAQRRERARALATEIGLERVLGSRADALSGGERRRLEIARVMAASPRVVLLDEPFTGLDPLVIGDLQALIAGMAARQVGVLITDHSVHDTLRIVDRAYLLVDGRVVAHGTPQELVADPVVRRSYLGDGFQVAPPG